ncbi:hypothetical protein PDESU_03344 [Pontiella desulfatans]|uniref:Uncharacterized protein n=1 Tax=Pontiella desulfatans TaxID=2750659 RepID=A0A6C2U4F0_PONDE|nr:hypothetical protein [Pontiella desulfatans]VGO14775.1 hypothetical protein PDESU_03344 [Pontiella desulfatans]
MHCKAFPELMAWQIQILKDAIDEDKWLLSERAGRDVGLPFATADFERRHLRTCAISWRIMYCGSICDHRDGCDIGKRMVARDKARQEETTESTTA